MICNGSRHQIKQGVMQPLIQKYRVDLACLPSCDPVLDGSMYCLYPNRFQRAGPRIFSDAAGISEDFPSLQRFVRMCESLRGQKLVAVKTVC